MISVILVNLGTPGDPSTPAVRRYLREFLSDPRVIEVPKIVWWFILNLVILPIRSPRSAKKYQTIWDSERGFPLLYHSRDLLQKLQSVNERKNTDFHLGMTYGEPSLRNLLEELRSQDIDRLVILPLFPQYSATTSGAVFDALTEELRRWRRLPSLSFVAEYFDHPRYIDAIARSIRSQVEHAFNGNHRLLFSFHGLPQKYSDAGDPYARQCEVTMERIADALQLPAGSYGMSYQSRVAGQPWLQPYTDVTLQQWAESGVESVAVVCPGFACDCLETVEEIDQENREIFLSSGGKDFTYISCLNSTDSHATLLQAVIDEHLPRH